MAAEPTSRFARALLGTDQLVAVDVGAARGLLPHWRALAPAARIYLFEPDVDAVPKIREQLAEVEAADAHVMPYGLSEDGGPKTLHRLGVPTGSSLLPLRLPEALDHAESAVVFPQSELVVDTRTLAAVFDERNEPRVDMIKLDTQGTELSILKGLGARGANMVSLELEVGIAENYEGACSLGEVVAYAEARGLELFDLMPKRYPLLRAGVAGVYERKFGTYRRSPSLGEQLVEVDAMFFRKRNLAIASGDGATVRRLAVAYCCYGRFAHAHRLIELAVEAGVVPQPEMPAIEATLVGWHRATYHPRVVLDVAEKVISRLGDRLTPARQTTGRR
jgi:FkbM family methyltransferase